MKIKKKIRRFIRVLKNIKHYWKYIVDDAQWDDYYIYKILYAKLDAIDKYYTAGVDMPYVNEDDSQKNIKICKELCKRLYGDFHFENSHREYYSKYKIVMEMSPDDDSEYTTLHTRHVKYNGDELSESEREKAKKLMMTSLKKEQDMTQHDKEYLFKLLLEESYKWWD
jgi:hypothetical protein